MATIVFDQPITWIRSWLFSTSRYDALVSDSASLYSLAIALFIAALVLSLFRKKVISQLPKVYQFSFIIISYYLALQLMNYGFDKIFKQQFYLPEPNILFTPVGNMDKDMLLWTTIGASYPFCFFLGLSEVVTGALLLFQRTRFLGSVLSLLIFLNVVAINFGYDISLKLYSSFLLFLSIFSLSNFRIDVRDRAMTIHSSGTESSLSLLGNRPFLYYFLKSVAVLLILLEASFTNISSGMLNDDMAERPYLHGAYNVLQATENEVPTDELKRLFFHRMNYLILQDKHDRMSDFRLQVSPHKLLLIDALQDTVIASYNYLPQDSILTMTYTVSNKRYHIRAKRMDLTKMPLLQRNFHWTIDEVK